MPSRITAQRADIYFCHERNRSPGLKTYTGSLSRIPDRKSDYVRWDMGDGYHVGQIGVVVRDGRVGIRQEPNHIRVEGVTGRHLRDPDSSGFELVTEDSAVGWQPVCECGWSGDTWNRVGSDYRIQETRLSAKGLIGSSAVPPLHLEQTAMNDWRQHVLSWGIEMAARSLRRSSERLDSAVAAARAAGLTWADIGRDAGITRQAAHQRWAGR